MELENENSICANFSPRNRVVLSRSEKRDLFHHRCQFNNLSNRSRLFLMGNPYLQQRFEGSDVGYVTLFLTLSYKSYKIWTSNVKFGNKLIGELYPPTSTSRNRQMIPALFLCANYLKPQANCGKTFKDSRTRADNLLVRLMPHSAVIIAWLLLSTLVHPGNGASDCTKMKIPKIYCDEKEQQINFHAFKSFSHIRNEVNSIFQIF